MQSFNSKFNLCLLIATPRQHTVFKLSTCDRARTIVNELGVAEGLHKEGCVEMPSEVRCSSTVVFLVLDVQH